MTSGEKYRHRAAQFDATAKQEGDPRKRTEFDRLARSYRRLAEQADINDQLDLACRPPRYNPQPT